LQIRIVITPHTSDSQKFKRRRTGWVWWCMPVIPAFKMQRQEIHEFEAKFQTSLGYTKLQTLSQKKKKKKKKKNKQSKFG
jgi:hypothetical protein